MGKQVELKAFRSERMGITIQVGSVRYKAFQMFFGRDRSLFVNFRYFRHREAYWHRFYSRRATALLPATSISHQPARLHRTWLSIPIIRTAGHIFRRTAR